MTVKTLREFLAMLPDDWVVSIAMPHNCIEGVQLVERDPYADEEDGILIWPDSVHPLPMETPNANRP